MLIRLNDFFTQNELFTIKSYLQSIHHESDKSLSDSLTPILLRDARQNNAGAQLSILYFTFNLIRKVIAQFEPFLLNGNVSLEDFKSWAYIALCDTDTISANKVRATKNDTLDPSYNGIKFSVLSDSRIQNTAMLLLNMKSKFQDVVGFNLRRVTNYGITDLDKNTSVQSLTADRSKDLTNTSDDVDFTYHYTKSDYTAKDYSDNQRYVSNISSDWQEDDDLVVLFNLLIEDELFEGNSKGLTPIVVLKAVFSVLCGESGEDKKLTDSAISKEIARMLNASGSVQPSTWKPCFELIGMVANLRLDMSISELIKVFQSLSYKYEAKDLIAFIDENSL